MKSNQRILITVGACVVLVLGFFLITGAITKHTGFSVSEIEKNSFESCLEEQEIVLYINTNNVSQTLQNIELFDYLQHFEIMNCLSNNQKCIENNINSFPSWNIESNKIRNDINLGKLKEISGCE